jgi:polysaccharide export outer membrane protein
MRNPIILLFALLLSFCFLTSPLIAETDRPSYQIGPGDVLTIYVWKEAELTRDITVMFDGRITFPLIGEIMAQGLSLSALKETVTQKLKKYLTAPEVTIIVTDARSRRIYTVGKLNRPGPYPLEADMTVIQALSTAGGFAEWADTKNIVIIRRQGEKDAQIYFNYKDFISGKNLGQNIVLEPNDTIVVP